jgi:hypothetical protein
LQRKWIEAGERAPRPDWSILDSDFHFEHTSLEEPNDEEPIELDFRFEALELTEHQKMMLQRPEDRIKAIVYPEFVQKRAERKLKNKRGNKWGNKFKKHFTGKVARAWRVKIAKHSMAELKASCEPKAKVQWKATAKANAEAAPSDKKVSEANASRSQALRATCGGKREELNEHPFLKKQVRVTCECTNEGRCGEVTKVHKVFGTEAESEYIECHVFSDKGTFTERLNNIEEKREAAPEPAGFKLDYRRLKAPQRAALKHKLEGVDGNLELIVDKTMLEQSTVAAILLEMELRLCPEDTKIVVPSIATAWSLGEPPEDHGGEVATFKVIVKTTKHLLFVLWSEPPRHYTMLYVKNIEGHPRHIEFKDSMPGETARQAATRLLRNLELIEHGQECPKPCNTSKQADGWSCGLWASRWVERQLRENKGEDRLIPTSLAEMRNRANEFIAKIKDSKKDAPVEAKGDKAPSKSYPTHEPVHETLEEALFAATVCTKCLPTKAGTKGCRACMGEHFEAIRQRKSKGK